MEGLNEGMHPLSLLPSHIWKWNGA